MAVALLFTLILVESASAAGRRVALVIGNSAYSTLPALDNPGKDVESVAAVLRASDFDVVVGADLPRIELEKTLQRFFRSLDKSDVSLFYYSGHGVQIGGKNYIIPVDASLKSPYDIEAQTINLDTVLDFMRANTKTQLVFLDACRNNPFGADAYWVADKLQPVGATVGLADVKPAVGTLIAFATDPGAVSFDGGPTGMSPFSQAFVKRAPTPNAEIRTVLTQVRRDVVEATGGRQVPWENSSLVEDFYLQPRRAPPRIPGMIRLAVPAGKTLTLDLPEPEVDGKAELSVSFDLLPEQGRLLADGRPVELGRAYPVSLLRDAIYDAAGAVDGASEVASFTVTDSLNQSARGLVSISIEPAGDARVAQAAPPDRTRAIAVPSAVEVPIGVGPVVILSAVPEEEDAGAAAAGKKPNVEVAALDQGSGPQVILTDAPETGLLAVGERRIGSGAVLNAGSLSSLSYEPQIGAEHQQQRVRVEVVAANEAPHASDITVTPVIDRCDELAGEPFDLQGVAKGVLPNEIKLPEALDACRAAMKRYPGVPRFRYELGRAELADRDVKGAVESFRQAADAGHQRALYGLGYVQALGIGGEADLRKANDFYHRNADFGDPYGMLAYGRNLFYGRGIDKDVEKGLTLMIKSAELGHTYAMNELGAIFTRGANGQSDPARGIAYYRRGVDRGDIYSFNNLGLALLRGEGVEKDDKAAFEMFTKAMAGGHPGAPANLGLLYLQGRGIAKDASKAESLFETAAERGDRYGAMMRGDMALDLSKAPAAKAEAARYYAMSMAFDRHGNGPEVRKKLASLPKSARQAALADLLKEVKGVKVAGSLDERLVAAALARWKRLNPRMDLF